MSLSGEGCRALRDREGYGQSAGSGGLERQLVGGGLIRDGREVEGGSGPGHHEGIDGQAPIKGEIDLSGDPVGAGIDGGVADPS